MKNHYSVRVQLEDGRATSKGEQHALGREAVRDLRREIAPPIHETLATAIRRHGGARSVLIQSGMPQGAPRSAERKAFDNTLRTIERHAQTGGNEKNQRGRSGIKGKYSELYDKVLGKETVERIKNGGKGGEPGPLPRRGVVHMTVSGEIEVSEDIRDRAVNIDMDPADYADLTADPLGKWIDDFPASVRLNDVEWIELSWESDE